MKIIDLKKAYKAPLAKVITVKSQGMLCLSNPEAKNTEQFTLSSHQYGDDDFE